MDINLLKRLIKLVEKSEITEFSVQEGDLKVRISKNSKGIHNFVTNTPVDYHNPAITGIPPRSESTESTATEKTVETSENLHEVKSPIVGTFYRAPAPDADPYIQIGDQISVGTVLCIVEAMKLMNEIESDINGKIVKILVENATPVEYNQPLFLIEKS